MDDSWWLGEIVLVRHAQSMANAREVSPMETGDHNVQLTPAGEAQADEVGKALSGFIRDARFRTLIYCSPYTRTRQTMARLLASADANPAEDGLLGSTGPDKRVVYEDPRLREVDHGYGTIEDYERQQPLRERHGWFYYRFHGGESPADCYDRVTGFTESLWRQAERKQARRVLIVSHGLTIRCLVMRFLHLKVEDFDRMANPANASVIRLVHSQDDAKHDGAVFRNGRWSVHGLKLREREPLPPEPLEPALPRPVAPRQHCLHVDGVVSRVDQSTAWTERCCHCGRTRSVCHYFTDDLAHGPHVKDVKKLVVSASELSLPCVPSDAARPHAPRVPDLPVVITKE